MRQQILGFQHGQLIEIANKYRITPSNNSARYSFRQSSFRKLAHPQQADARKKIKCDKCTARKVDANLKKECDECEQQSCRKPANQYFPGLDARLGAVWKSVVTAPLHSQDVEQACEKADSAIRREIGHRIAGQQ